jgi:hypothetical protein
MAAPLDMNAGRGFTRVATVLGKERMQAAQEDLSNRYRAHAQWNPKGSGPLATPKPAIVITGPVAGYDSVSVKVSAPRGAQYRVRIGRATMSVAEAAGPPKKRPRGRPGKESLIPEERQSVVSKVVHAQATSDSEYDEFESYTGGVAMDF